MGKLMPVIVVLFSLILQLNAVGAEINTLGEVTESIKWNSKAASSFYFVQATDLHINDRGPLKMANKFSGNTFIDDINQLLPRPAFFIVTGDLVSDTFRHSSSWPRAEKGFAATKKLFSKLKIPYHLVMGNNGCSPEAFHKVWPKRPLYWSFTKDGVLFVGLMGYNLWKHENSNHAGIVLDKKQLAWLAKDLQENRKSKSLVIFTHEPLGDPDCHLIRDQLAPLLEKFPGEIWSIAGHNHRNLGEVFQFGKVKMNVLQTITPTGAWKPSKGAYRLIFFKGGKLIGSALRWVTKDGKPLYFEIPRGKDTWPKIMPAYEALKEQLVWKIAVGAGDQKYRNELVKVQDRISNLRIRKWGFAVYKIPLKTIKEKTEKIFLLASQNAKLDGSGDGKNWQQLELAPEKIKGSKMRKMLTAKLDKIAMDSGSLYLKIMAGEKDVKLYGLGIIK